MIIDLQRFIDVERPHWAALETSLNQIEENSNRTFTLQELTRFHYLYERASADLAKLNTFASEPELKRYLENLVARAYGEIHETREKRRHFNIQQWLFVTLPQTFRRHINAFWLTVAITIAGCALGGFATILDPESRAITMPFGHDKLDPAQRVAQEESAPNENLSDSHARFSTYLMTHNIHVSIFTLALGMTYGVGTILVLFQNGIMLGAIAVDYIHAGQTVFLLGWLLPHGVIEIPAILIAGQAGFTLAKALIGRGKGDSVATRLRDVSGDVVTLIAGVALFLVWAGFIESFLSQYHEPVIPYSVKIAFGLVELALLILYLGRCGRNPSPREAHE